MGARRALCGVKSVNARGEGDSTVSSPTRLRWEKRYPLDQGRLALVLDANLPQRLLRFFPAGRRRMTSSGGNAVGLQDYVDVLRRRKWLIVLIALWVPLTAAGYSLLQQRLYQASADVLINRSSPAALAIGVEDPSAKGDPNQLIQTERALAHVPAVAAGTLKRLGLRDRTPQELLAHVSVTANAFMLKIRVTDPNPSLVVRLATQYAREFTTYRRQLDTARIEAARSQLKDKILRSASSASRDARAYAEQLRARLQAIEATQTSNALVVGKSNRPQQVQPRTARTVVVASILGVILGVVFAFIRDAFDRRVRSADEVTEKLGLALLGRLPSPRRQARKQHGLAMLEEPVSVEAEAIRVLRAHLEFANRSRGARSIVVTSAVPGEGKSTTAANLAIAMARAGKHVILVDLDLRRPSLDRFFGLEGRPGVGDVIRGDASLEEAIVPVPVHADTGSTRMPLGNGNTGNGRARGLLRVLPAGIMLQDVGEQFAGDAIQKLLQAVLHEGDLVLIDAPALLAGADTMAMSENVDALILAVRLNATRESMLDEVRRVLDSCHTPVLGVVLTGADTEAPYGYSAYGERYREPHRHSLFFPNKSRDATPHPSSQSQSTTNDPR